MSIFGSGTSTSNIFSNKDANKDNKDNQPTGFSFGNINTNTSSTTGLFGTPKPPGAGTSLFGGTTGGSSTPGGNSGMIFGGTNTSSTPSSGAGTSSSAVTNGSTPSTTPATGGSGLFGGGPSGPFGGALGATSTAGLTTPAAKPPGGLFATSSAAPAAPAAPLTQPSSGLFGGPKPESANTPSSIFGGGGSSAASTTPATKPPQSLFGNAQTSSNPSTSTVGLFTASKPAGTSSSLGSGNASTPVSTQPSSSVPSSGLFGSGMTSTPSASRGTPSAAAASSSLFGTATTQASKPEDTPAVSTTPGLFGQPATAATLASTSATAASGTPTTSSLFGTTLTSNAGTAQAAITPAAGGLSSGQAATQPPLQSRLKNKSMEEIIGRWTSDLEKYRAEFISQAEEIKKWDAVLITNGDKLVNLSAETTEAEKTQARMDTVLQQLENEQEELGTALDYYESQIKDFFDAQFGSAEGMQPADQEREKTYSLAEKLNETLIGMEGDLGEMIKAINKAGATINKTTNADDPLSQIVKILNDHLSSLQWIDTHTIQVAEKIQEAQKRGSERSSGVLGGDDEFFSNISYRSTLR